MKVIDVYKIIDKIAPFENQCDFDNAGFLVGDRNAEVTGAVVTLDCTDGAVDYAIKNNANLIITHHPVIFDPLKNVMSGSVLARLIKNDISVISAHTNLDFSKGGINDTLCSLLHLKRIKRYGEYKFDVFELRIGETEPITAAEFAEKLKRIFNIPIKYNDGGNIIKKVAVCSGSGGSFLERAKKHHADALVTADIRHNQFMLADNLKISLFDCGHHNTENIIVNPLCEVLKNAVDFPLFPCDSEIIKYC